MKYDDSAPRRDLGYQICTLNIQYIFIFDKVQLFRCLPLIAPVQIPRVSTQKSMSKKSNSCLRVTCSVERLIGGTVIESAGAVCRCQ